MANKVCTLIENVKAKGISKAVKRRAVLLSAVFSLMALSVTSYAANEPLLNVSGVDFTIVLKEMLALIPSILPAALACIGVRKAIGFLFGMIRGM